MKKETVDYGRISPIISAQGNATQPPPGIFGLYSFLGYILGRGGEEREGGTGMGKGNGDEGQRGKGKWERNGERGEGKGERGMGNGNGQGNGNGNWEWRRGKGKGKGEWGKGKGYMSGTVRYGTIRDDMVLNQRKTKGKLNEYYGGREKGRGTEEEIGIIR